MAAAPSVTALTHLAIVWEALLIESECRKGERGVLTFLDLDFCLCILD